MVKEAERSDGVGVVVDPLANYWGLSLFGVPPPSPSTNPYNPEHDLHAIHSHLRSMALRSPVKLLEQTKSILDGNPGLFNAEISSDPTPDERSDVVDEEAEGFPRKRRPALGFKRARFSLKLNRNPSVENLIPNLDIDKLKDPVQFFLAHERLENAKREIQKQMGGVSFEQNQDNTSTKPQQRRPGLSGNSQRPVRYRHRYSLETDNSDHVPSSQEAIGSDCLDPVGEKTDEGGACLTSLENEVTDSSAIEENKLNDLLDGLLSCNSEDLEGDGAINLLQEKLQIKPIVLENLSVPDFPDNQVIDLNSLRGNLSKPRKALSNIDNLLKGMNNRTPLRKDVQCPVQQLGSPTPPRSPFAPLSSLQKYISQSKPSVDPFSAHEIDHSSTRNYSPTHMINQELNLVCSGNPSNELNAPSIEVANAAIDASSVKNPVGNCANTSQESNEDKSRKHGFDANIDSNEAHVDMDVDIGRPNFEAKKGPCEFEDDILAENMQAIAASVPPDDSDFNLVNLLGDQSGPAGVQASAMDESTQRSEDGPAECLQVQQKTDGSMIPVNGQSKPVNGQSKRKLRSQGYKDKSLARRQSLAAAGTSMKSGVRRSTRIRTRPLEYWKGERLVYGRVHESLATVIGVKCMSPGSDGKPTMKVKSYVPDKYKELLELASLY